MSLPTDRGGSALVALRRRDVPLLQEDGSRPASYYLGATKLTYEQLRALPTSTAALYTLVEREARVNHNSHGTPHEMESRQLVFDAQTAALLGERELDADGRPLFVSAYLASGVVDSASQRPKP